MKVKELQVLLSKYAPDMEVLCYSEDEVLQEENKHLFRLLNIDSVDLIDAEITRLDDQSPTMIIGKNPKSKPIVSLSVTIYF